MIARECGSSPENLHVLIAKTASIAGSVQISARMVETCLYKMDHLGLDVSAVSSARGTAPIAPIIGDDNRMMGITNDMIIYGSKVHLKTDAEIESGNIPSSSSPDYGKPFADIFKAAGYNFYKIDEAIFAPAEVVVENTSTGHEQIAGSVNAKIIRKVTGG